MCQVVYGLKLSWWIRAYERWKYKVPWNSGTGNYTGKGKEKCWQIGQNNSNRGSSVVAGKGKADKEERIQDLLNTCKSMLLAEQK